MTTKPEPIPDNVVELVDNIFWLVLCVTIFLFLVSAIYLVRELLNKKRDKNKDRKLIKFYIFIIIGFFCIIYLWYSLTYF